MAAIKAKIGSRLGGIASSTKIKAKIGSKISDQYEGQDFTSVNSKPNMYEAKLPSMLPMSTTDIPRLVPVRSLYKPIPLDATQMAAVRDIRALRSCMVIGSAGAGKTAVAVQGVLEAVRFCPPMLEKSNAHYQDIEHCDPDHKYLRRGNPGFIVVSLTRNAVENLMVRLPDAWDYTYEDEDGDTVDLGSVNLRDNCMTIHKLLEYRPQRSTMDNAGEGDGQMFVPYRTRENKLPGEIRAVLLDEGTLVRLDLLRELIDALPEGCAIFVCGDIYQINAVGGLSVLAAFSTFYNVHVLSKVYRHEGHIVRMANEIRMQRTQYYGAKANLRYGEPMHGSVHIITYAHERAAPEPAYIANGNYLYQEIVSGKFVPGLDMAISFHDPDISTIPNKFGITNIFRTATQQLDEYLGRKTYYVRTANRTFGEENAHVLAAGDIVYADINQVRSTYMIMRITRNPQHSGEVFPPMTYRTRDPVQWLEWAKSDSNVLHGRMMDAAFNDAAALDTGSGFDDIEGSFAMDKAIADNAEATRDKRVEQDKVGRKATHNLIVLDIGALYQHILTRTETSYDAEVVTEYAIKRLLHAAIVLDFRVTEESKTISDAEFKNSIEKVADMCDVGGFVKAELQSLNTGAAIKGIKPWVLTAHVSQGSSGRRVVVMTHQDTPGFTEYVYTSFTRARLELTMISHAALWATNPENNKHRSDIHSPQIAGVTVPEKIRTIEDMIAKGKGGVTYKDLEFFKKYIYGDKNYQASRDWESSYLEEG